MSHISKLTVEEFLASGGKITTCKAQNNETTTTAGDFIKKDIKLKALRSLKRKLDPDNDNAHNLINEAIRERLAILKH